MNFYDCVYYNDVFIMAFPEYNHSFFRLVNYDKVFVEFEGIFSFQLTNDYDKKGHQTKDSLI